MEPAAEAFDRLDALPDDCAPLLDAGGASFFLGRAWWASMREAGLAAGVAPRFLLCRSAGRPAAILPLQSLGGRLEGQTNPYTCLFAPLLAPGLDDAALLSIGRRLARACRGTPVLRLDALPRGAPRLDRLFDGMRAGGRLQRDFEQFGNWHEPVEGLDWAAYLQRRPGALRETLRRRLRQGERAGVRFELVEGAGLEAGIAAYESVYARSWKVPEPLPNFNPVMMRHAAAVGALRLGVLRDADGLPIAVQLWVVAGGQASVLKLAHDEAFKPLSPGTLLTGMVIRTLLERGGLRELDFGRGDDAYKRLWAGSRRQRIGTLLIDPWHPVGLAALARQSLGGWRRRFG